MSVDLVFQFLGEQWLLVMALVQAATSWRGLRPYRGSPQDREPKDIEGVPALAWQQAYSATV